MAKITKLTPEQEARLPLFREEWRAVGTRTGHTAEDVEIGRAAIHDAYRELDLEPPKLVLYAQSPMQALLMVWLLGRAPKAIAPGEAHRGQLGGRLGGQLGDQLRGQLGGQLRVQLSDQLGDQLRVPLGDQLWDPLGDQLWDQLWDQLRSIYQQWWSFGQCDMYWTAWARFGADIGVKFTSQQERRLAIVERLARSAYMAFSWTNLTVLVQHPSVATFDDQHRLHRTDGPALAWPDGYAIYAIGGIRLTPERGAAMVAGTLTAQQISEEPNAEVRRVLIATYNARDTGRYVRDLGATIIHEDKDRLGFPRRLMRIEQPDDEPIVAVEVTNSTAEPDGHHKLYTFRCHPELRPLPVGPRQGQGLGEAQAMTCQNAIASTYGYRGEDFDLAVET